MQHKVVNTFVRLVTYIVDSIRRLVFFVRDSIVSAATTTRDGVVGAYRWTCETSNKAVERVVAFATATRNWTVLSRFSP